LLARWSARELLEIQALMILESEEDEERRRIPEQTPEQQLAMLDNLGKR